MQTEDVKDLLGRAMQKAGVDHASVRYLQCLLSDNGPCILSKKLAEYLQDIAMEHSRGKPYHPMTQGKIERYHRWMKNVVNFGKYCFPWELEQEIAHFVEHYNNESVHETLGNVTPADVYFGPHREIFTRREQIKRRTLNQRRHYSLREHQRQLHQQSTLKLSIVPNQKLSGSF